MGWHGIQFTIIKREKNDDDEDEDEKNKEILFEIDEDINSSSWEEIEFKNIIEAETDFEICSSGLTDISTGDWGKIKITLTEQGKETEEIEIELEEQKNLEEQNIKKLKELKLKIKKNSKIKIEIFIRDSFDILGDFERCSCYRTCGDRCYRCGL